MARRGVSEGRLQRVVARAFSTSPSGGGGGGDMMASTYDPNGDGVVKDSDKLGGSLPSAFAPSCDEYTADPGVVTLGKWIRVRTAAGQPTLVKLGCVDSSGASVWHTVTITD